MRTSNQRPRQAGRKRAESITPFRGSASDHLALPKLHKGIPQSVEEDSWGHRWATIALLWLDAGFLTDADEGHPRLLCQTAIKRWLEQQTQGMKHLNGFDVSVHTFPNQYGEVPSANELEGISGLDTWMFGIYMNGGTFPVLLLENRVNALEEAHPGLGKTAWHWFCRMNHKLLPILTPDQVRYMAAYVWWNGEDDQESFEEMMKDCGAEPEDMGMGPVEFDGKYPEWIMKASEEVISREQLLEIVNNGKTPEAQAVAKQILAVAAMEEVPHDFPGFGDIVEHENVYFQAYIRWNKDDPMFEVYDDNVEYINNCGGEGWSEMLGADAVPLDPTDFNQWKTTVEAGFAVMRELDALLDLIADVD